MNPRVLVLDDDAEMVSVLIEGLTASGMTVTGCRYERDALDALRGGEVDVFVTDLNMPGANGLTIARSAIQADPTLPVIVITAFGSLETAIAAIRMGAYDFVTKPFRMEQLVLAVERAHRLRSLENEVTRLRRSAVPALDSGSLLGDSRPMAEVRQLLAMAARTDASVLIRGESGTGKELAARAIHGASRRAEGPFVAVNVAAMPSTLIESELFGHSKGAFTGADRTRSGLFEQAQGGTLLLDEIGDLAADLQPKLLRVLEERRVRGVGGSHDRAIDVRVIAATNRDLESGIEQGTFREDLFYRLAVFEVALPPLRARGGDVLQLAQAFVQELGAGRTPPMRGLSKDAAAKLLDYPWPGNVRELRNAMEYAVALARHVDVAPADLPPRVQEYEPRHVVLGSDNPRDLVPLAEVERRYILHVLESTNGNRTEAARILGLGRKTLYRKLAQYRRSGSEEAMGSAAVSPTEMRDLKKGSV